MQDHRKQKQAFRHEPEVGVYGDCFRTAIAMMINMPRDEVPHVFGAGQSGEEGHAAMDAFLATKGLRLACIAFQGSLGLESTLSYMGQMNPEVYWCLGGTSKRGTGHFVLCRGGEIHADPSISESGIVGPMEEGYFYAYLATLR